MATVTCESCQQTYDNAYRWTFCPHDFFQMRTLVVGKDGTAKICRSVEELLSFIDQEEGK